MIRVLGSLAVLITAGSASGVLGQTPRPFPRPGGTTTRIAEQRPQPPPADVPLAASPVPQAPPAGSPQSRPAVPGEPTEATLGFPVYPTAQFIASYDAGRSQRYFVFGAPAPYAEIVAYYRTILKERGDEVFREPPTHMFEVGRFREETMAFPPGVTVKDWTWGGSAGYPNPRTSAQPARFPTIIMIVPAPPATPQR